MQTAAFLLVSFEPDKQLFFVNLLRIHGGKIFAYSSCVALEHLSKEVQPVRYCKFLLLDVNGKRISSGVGENSAATLVFKPSGTSFLNM